jgi:ketosteroid isomerase-like protein
MKNFVLALAALAIAANVSAQSAVEAELRRLNDDVSEMQVKKDVATADRLLADEYVFLQADGGISNKAGTLSVLKSPDFDCTLLTTEDVQVRVYGNAAVITGVARFEATLGGRDVGGVFRYTDVWVKRNGHWQTVSSHASPLPQMEVQRLTSALVGAWKLVSWETRTTDGGLSWPMGKSPVGMLTYDDSGRVAVQIMQPNTQGALAYFGTYTVDDMKGTVTHHVEASSFPDEVGTDLTGSLRMNGHSLTIVSATKTPTGKAATSVLSWQRLP